MERYLSAAERIARWAISTEIPAKPLEVGYLDRERRIRRVGSQHYRSRTPCRVRRRVHRPVRSPGRASANRRLRRRAGEARFLDGRQSARHANRGDEAVRPRLLQSVLRRRDSGCICRQGDHVFRAGFIDDEFVKILPDEMPTAAASTSSSIRSCSSVRSRRATEKEQPEEDPHVRSRIRPRVRRADRDRSGAPRVPAPADEPARSIRSCALSTLRRRSGQSAEQGVQLAIQAMLVSPNFLFRIERDPDPRDPALVHEVSPFELASRVSYFLWSSMPDDELLALAESREACATRACSRRRSIGCWPTRARRRLPQNFAGQWLETRNLDVVKPDPGQVQGMDSRAARGDEGRDDDVLRARAAREPSGERFPERELHVPQRAARARTTASAACRVRSSAESS